MGLPKGQKIDAEALKDRRLEARRLLIWELSHAASQALERIRRRARRPRLIASFFAQAELF